MRECHRKETYPAGEFLLSLAMVRASVLLSTWQRAIVPGGHFNNASQDSHILHAFVLRYYTNMPCQCGYPDGMHICFIIPNKPQFGKISMETTMTAGRSSENGGRFAGGHFAGGHDGMANLCKPIRAYDFHVRYNKIK